MRISQSPSHSTAGTDVRAHQSKVNRWDNGPEVNFFYELFHTTLRLNIESHSLYGDQKVRGFKMCDHREESKIMSSLNLNWMDFNLLKDA